MRAQVDKNFLTAVNRKKPTTMSQLADIWYGSQGEDYGRNQHYNGSRSVLRRRRIMRILLNYHATFTKGTVEFRLFQFDAPSNGKQNGAFSAKRIMRSQQDN